MKMEILAVQNEFMHSLPSSKVKGKFSLVKMSQKILAKWNFTWTKVLEGISLAFVAHSSFTLTLNF